ncbi:MAG: transposase [Thaumarchaeota archaeon]|nr:transposase [Nitrososphaerota archaeon]
MVKKTPRISNHVPPKEELEIWQKDAKKEAEMPENDGFTLVMADESHQNSNIFGSGATYVRGDGEPIPMPPGNQRQTVYGGVTLDGQTCRTAADKANDRSFIRYLDKLQRRFGKVAVVADNAAYHNFGRVRRHLEKNNDFIRLMFLQPYSPFLNPAEWLWRSSKTKIRRISRLPAKSYFRRKIMLVYESLEIKFDPRNILFRDLDKMLLL